MVPCRASFQTPRNATSRTTAQDALWQHILDRNTSSQPFMTPCARQVMNRIPGDLTPSWAGCWGPPHSCSLSRAIYLPAQRNRQPARPTPPRPRPPSQQGKATPGPVWHWPAIWNHLNSDDSCDATWTLSLRNFLWTCKTSPEYFRHQGHDYSTSNNSKMVQHTAILTMADQ